MLARKNGKTPFTTAKIWMLGVAYSRSYSKIKTVAGSAKQNMEGFGFLGYNLHRLGLTVREDAVHGLRVLDSSLGHSYSGAIWDGQISFDALAYTSTMASGWICAQSAHCWAWTIRPSAARSIARPAASVPSAPTAAAWSCWAWTRSSRRCMRSTGSTQRTI